MGAFFARFRRQPAQSDDAPTGPSRVTDQDKAVFVSNVKSTVCLSHNIRLRYHSQTKDVNLGRFSCRS